MKMMNPLLAIVMFFVAFQSSHGENLMCSEFKDQSFYLVGIYYSCAVTSLENPSNNKIITGYTGQHKPYKYVKDVRAIYIHDTTTKFIPAQIGFLFDLAAFYMERTQLVEIKAKDFNGMQNLEVLSFYKNELTSVPMNAFSKLSKLRIIILSGNQIEELPNGLFSNNDKLENIYLYDTKIKFLGPKLFEGLWNLNKVDLDNNICISYLYQGSTAITQLKIDVQFYCKKSNYNTDVSTKLVTLSDMTNQLLKASDQHHNDQIEINKMKTELRELMEIQKTNEIAMNQLKKELLDAKHQRQIDEYDVNVLRTNLTKSNELLTNCRNEMKCKLRAGSFLTWFKDCNFFGV